MLRFVAVTSSNLIGRRTIKIPEIISGVHAFMVFTVKLAAVNIKMSMLLQDILPIFHNLFILQNSWGKRQTTAISTTKGQNSHVFTWSVLRTRIVLMRNENCVLLPLTKRLQYQCLCWLLGTLLKKLIVDTF